ncbi:MAG: hypothetical protein JSW49_06190 [candidate division WOR-3 bacterium]|nr:MAG: hypothetical protein JSW49_06190 [candidate division WOR-3 bacterium]
MKVKFRKYEPERDFLRVRDMLVQTFHAFEKPINWTFERWNYARYFAAPMLGAYGETENTTQKSLDAIRLWEDAVGIWEDENSEIAAVVCPDEHVPDHPSYGLAYFQRRPGYDFLLEEMLDYTEETYINSGRTRIFITEHDESLRQAAQKRGYRKGEKSWGWWAEYVLKDLPAPNLPQGFRFQSMADDNDLEKRRKIFGLSFRHKDPNEWPTLFSYQELQRAPDYRKDLDLVIVGPDGEYVACSIVWIDTFNKVARLEPVGSIVLGMGREIVMEGLSRAAALGMERSYMESGLRFYQAIGFKRLYEFGYTWTLMRQAPR